MPALQLENGEMLLVIWLAMKRSATEGYITFGVFL